MYSFKKYNIPKFLAAIFMLMIVAGCGQTLNDQTIVIKEKEDSPAFETFRFQLREDLEGASVEISINVKEGAPIRTCLVKYEEFHSWTPKREFVTGSREAVGKTKDGHTIYSGVMRPVLDLSDLNCLTPAGQPLNKSAQMASKIEYRVEKGDYSFLMVPEGGNSSTVAVKTVAYPL